MRKTLAVALAVVALGASAAMAKPARVRSVQNVTAKLKGNQITVVAKGTVNTGGWTNPQLVQIAKTSTTLTFEFVAEPPPPDSIVTQAITKIEATTTTGPLRPPFPKKVKVVARTNSKTVNVTK